MKQLMIGNEAVARGVYEAGCTVATAYPGTPSTEITEYIAKYDGIYSEWSPNEKVAAEVAIGASIAGARAVCSMKHVGLNVAADPLFTASYSGVNGGLVFMVADDPGMHSSQNEQDTRLVAKAALVPVLEPADSAECLSFVKKAFELSEKFDTPVIVRLTTRVAHSRSVVEVSDKEDYELKEYVKNYKKNVMMPAMARERHKAVEAGIEEIEQYSSTSELNSVEHNGTKIGVITSGICYQYAREAFGDSASYLKLGIVYPISKKLITEFAKKYDTLYVIEELEPHIEDFVKTLGINVIGKQSLTKQGEYSAKMLAEKLLGKKDAASDNKAEVTIPNRPPVMCTGCPHRATFLAINKLGLTVTGDIGCYTLGALPPISAMDTQLCMGASIGMSLGFEKARGIKTVAVIGDSTFIHSGITGLIDVVYNKGTSTVIIMDNSITGMTGHQQNPSTGYTIKNEQTNSIDLAKLCEAVGVKHVRTLDPFDTEKFTAELKEAMELDEPSVIIAQSPCVLLKGIAARPALKIDTDKCKKCRACLKVGCPAISDITGCIEIDEAQCRGCKLCVTACKFDAIAQAEV